MQHNKRNFPTIGWTSQLYDSENSLGDGMGNLVAIVMFRGLSFVSRRSIKHIWRSLFGGPFCVPPASSPEATV